MTKSPFLWLAGVTCALGGAVAGNALGSTPVIARPAIGTFYQSHDDAVLSDDTASTLLPDHYALVTRERTVSVAELADRGLYSQSRYRGVYTSSDDLAGAMQKRIMRRPIPNRVTKALTRACASGTQYPKPRWSAQI